MTIPPDEPETTQPALLDPTDLYPVAGANGQRVIPTPTDILTVQTPTGPTRIRRFDGKVVSPSHVTEPTH